MSSVIGSQDTTAFALPAQHSRAFTVLMLKKDDRCVIFMINRLSQLLQSTLDAATKDRLRNRC
jgi:hypothetical protein